MRTSPAPTPAPRLPAGRTASTAGCAAAVVVVAGCATAPPGEFEPAVDALTGTVITLVMG